MAAESTTKSRPVYNREVLRWARELAGMSQADAAHSLKVKEEQIAAWEDRESTAAPTVRQARNLAKTYKRPFLEFFRNSTPSLPDPALIPDFRLYRSSAEPRSTRELKDIQVWAESQRSNALDLYSAVGEPPPNLPESLLQDIDTDPELAAEQAREAIRFSVDDQVGLTADERRQIPLEIRRKIESLGILILRRTDLGTINTRGFCIAVYPLPIIVFGKEAPTAQAFTLGHEFAHVLIRQSAISGALTRTGGDAKKREVEEWCNRFASAFLIPRDALNSFFVPPHSPSDSIPDEMVHRAALHFGVSDHAMLIRMVHLRYVKSQYYWDVKKPQFDEEAREYKGFGRSLYYGSRYRNQLGELYTGLVLEAWSSGRITNHHAAEFMGIKNLQHMIDIRDHYRSG